MPLLKAIQCEVQAYMHHCGCRHDIHQLSDNLFVERALCRAMCQSNLLVSQLTQCGMVDKLRYNVYLASRCRPTTFCGASLKQLTVGVHGHADLRADVWDQVDDSPLRVLHVCVHVTLDALLSSLALVNFIQFLTFCLNIVTTTGVERIL